MKRDLHCIIWAAVFLASSSCLQWDKKKRKEKNKNERSKRKREPAKEKTREEDMGGGDGFNYSKGRRKPITKKNEREEDKGLPSIAMKLVSHHSGVPLPSL